MAVKITVIQNRVKICAERLKELRLSLDMSYAEFARSVRISPTAVKRYEEGERIPNISLLADISAKYNKSMEWLTGGEFAFKEDELVKAYRNLSKESQEAVLVFVKFVKEQEL